MSIWYFANVKDTDGNWHLKTGICTDRERLARRFKDKRTYEGHEYIETIQYNSVEDINNASENVTQRWNNFTISRNQSVSFRETRYYKTGDV